MCGLCGVFLYRGGPGQDRRPALDRMCDAMRARGPDGRGSWQSADGRIAFGHLRLAIIDLSDDGAQPFATADGRYTLVFNGEIYNYRELRADLVAAGTVFRSHSDTEVIVELYRRRGADAFALLRGMYAVALWDHAEQRLVLARDPFGIKPLYVADDGRALRFASQVKALVASGEVPSDADPAGQVGFFVWGHIPEPFTLYRAIAAFPPDATRPSLRTGPARWSPLPACARRLPGERPLHARQAGRNAGRWCGRQWPTAFATITSPTCPSACSCQRGSTRQ
jgi:asparagine synthase (glutamine-hydrolysing)